MLPAGVDRSRQRLSRSISSFSLALLGALGCSSPEYLLRLRDSEPGSAGSGGSGGSAPSSGGSGGGGMAGSSGSTTCSGYSEGARVELCSASYLGGSGRDTSSAAGVAADASPLIAGSFASADLGAPETTLLGGTSGAIIRLSHDGSRVSHVTRIGADVFDLKVLGSGSIAVVGDFGVALLASDALGVLWHDDLDGESALRVDAGEQGTLAVLTANAEVRLLSADGARGASFPVGGSAVEDLAVHEASGSVLVTGTTETTSCAMSMPFLRSFDFSGALNWTNYDHSNPGSWCAASRGLRLALAEDGLLYYAGEQWGGNTVHLRDPRDVSKPAPLVSYDAYSMGAGSAVQWYAFVAAFEPVTGAMRAGQLVLPRQPADGEPFGIGGEFRVGGLALDPDGRVYLGGEVTCCIQDRESLSLSGTAVGPYYGRENALLILAPNFQRRMTWATWTLTGASEARTSGVAVGQGKIVLAVNQTAGGAPLITFNAWQATPVGDSDVFVSVLPSP